MMRDVDGGGVATNVAVGPESNLTIDSGDLASGSLPSGQGSVLATFDNVDVDPLLARVLGVKTVRGDGKLSEVAAAPR